MTGPTPIALAPRDREPASDFLARQIDLLEKAGGVRRDRPDSIACAYVDGMRHAVRIVAYWDHWQRRSDVIAAEEDIQLPRAA